MLLRRDGYKCSEGFRKRQVYMEGMGGNYRCILRLLLLVSVFQVWKTVFRSHESKIMTANLLCLGGGVESLPIIQYVRNAGYRPVIFHRKHRLSLSSGALTKDKRTYAHSSVHWRLPVYCAVLLTRQKYRHDWPNVSAVLPLARKPPPTVRINSTKFVA